MNLITIQIFIFIISLYIAKTQEKPVIFSLLFTTVSITLNAALVAFNNILV